MKISRVAAVFVLCALGFASIARADPPVPEPSGYRTTDYKTATPATLDGAPALTVTAAYALWQKKAATFVDVLPQIPKPAGLAPGTIWRDTPRFDIPGSLWLPDTGYGALAPTMENYFRTGLKQASGGDHDRPLVFYCLRHCWMSWNAAKRAKALGYTHVLWYADGTQGWSDAGYPLAQQAPLPRP
jgi:PQQ-dependent catabolism-associated CXXCW motif protein